jgi:predicted MFS family arabinose efflux permease
MGCDLARMMLALSLALVHTEQEMWIAWTASTALVAFTVFFNPARAAIVTELVAPDHLLQANALQQSNAGLVMALGSLIGGIVTAHWGLDIAFVINAVSFLASALIIASVHVEPRFTEGGLRGDPEDFRPLRDIIRHSRVIKVLLLLAILWPIGGGAINVLLSVYAFEVFDAGATGVGLFYAALGAGFLASGLLARYIARRGRWVISAGLILEGLCHMAVSQSPTIWLACVALLIATLGAGISNACLDTVLKRSVPNAAQGRIFALLDSTSAVVMSGSMLLAGALLLHVSPRDVGLASGLILASGGAIAGVLMKRQPQTESN